MFKISDQYFNQIIHDSIYKESLPSNYDLDCFVTSEVAYNEIIAVSLPEEDNVNEAYLGTGPCQNLIYIAAYKPTLALILDARIDNLLVHLMHKVIFEHSETRLEYLCNLFSRKKVVANSNSWNTGKLLSAFCECPVTKDCFDRNVRWLSNIVAERWKLPNGLVVRLERIFSEFFDRQLAITSVNKATLINLDKIPCYEEVILASSSQGQNFHFLSTEYGFSYLRQMQVNNRVIPLLGNYTDPHSIDLVNKILADQSVKLNHIYLSNMEEFLVERYVIEKNMITSRPNPNGILVGKYKDAYNRLVSNLSGLSKNQNCMLIRFYFPGIFRGRKIGVFPWLQGHITFWDNYIQEYESQITNSIFSTYFC